MRLAEFQADRPTVDYPPDGPDSVPLPRSMPTKIGRYVVLDLLGVGGMGVVCTAYDPKLDRKVALKLLRRKKDEHDPRQTTGQARLIREAQALARLSHPNIVTVHDVDTYDGRIYMAMEYVDGTSLDRWLAKRKRGWRDVVGVFIDAAQGLAAAHEAGIVHRDFKPANVLIGKDGRVLVVDFGLAKSHDLQEKALGPRSAVDVDDDPSGLMDVIGSTRDSRLTQAGRTVGTPAYMALEQFLGLPVGPQTDQFSFGVALYEALYGYLPFPEDSSREDLIDTISSGRILEAPKDTVVPGWVHRVVLRTLQARPENRYSSVRDVIAALQADPAKRRRRLLGFGGGALLLGLGAYGIVQGLRPHSTPCSGADERMAAIWNPDRKAEIEAAFAGTHRPYAADAWIKVSQELDRRATQWATVHTAVCEATNVHRDQSPEMMDVRMACLDRRQREMGALIDVFTEPDDGVVSEAIEAVQSLENVEGCRTAQAHEYAQIVDDPDKRHRIDGIESMLARAKAQMTAGRPEPALAEATSALTLARELDYPPLLARAALLYARLRMDRATEPELVRPDIVEAIKLAALTEQPVLEADAWAALVVLDAGQAGGFERALALRLPAEMALERADDLAVEAAYQQAMGTVLSDNGHPDEALELMAKALRNYRTVLGDQHTKVATALSNVGVQYAKMGQTEQALNYLGQAAETVEQIYGSHHPLLGSIRINMGGVWQKAAEPGRAQIEYERAVEILSGAMPKGHPRTLKAMMSLAQTLQATDPERAARRFEEVLAIMAGQQEPNRPLMGTTYNSLGNLQRTRALDEAKAGDPERAAELRDDAEHNLRRALEVFEALDGGQRTRLTEMTTVRLNLCRVEHERGRIDPAMGHCQAAWDLQIASGKVSDGGVSALQELAMIQTELGHPERAIELLREGVAKAPMAVSPEVRLQLADALWEQPGGGGRSEARGVIRTAVEALRKDEAKPEALRDLQRWLREHE